MSERLTGDYYDEMQKMVRHYVKSDSIDLNTGGDDFQDVVDRLAEYETAEAEGRLAVLPCRLNDIVYLSPIVCLGLDADAFRDRIIPCRVREIALRDYGIFLKLLSERPTVRHYAWHNSDEIGKTIFLSEDKARQALARKTEGES